MIVESFDKALRVCERFNNGNYSGIQYGYIDLPQQCNSLNGQWMFRPIDVIGTNSVNQTTKLYSTKQPRHMDGKICYELSSFSTQYVRPHQDYVKIGFLFGEGILNGHSWDRPDDTLVCMVADSMDNKKRKMV
jgi:hypothetical protein